MCMLDYYEHESLATPLTMVQEFAKLSGQKPDKHLYANLITEEYDEWDFEADLQSAEMRKHHGYNYHPERELKELADLVYVIYGYANARDWDLDEALKRVHENNVGRMYQPDGTIHRREDGKILKNKDYPKVDLSDLV